VRVVVMSTDTYRFLRPEQSRDGDRECGEADASKDGASRLDQYSQATGHGGGVFHTQNHVDSAYGCGSQSNRVFDTDAGTVRRSPWRAYDTTNCRG